ASDSAQLLWNILNEDPAPLHEVCPSLGAEISRIVAKALAKDPNARYGTASDLRDDLERARGVMIASTEVVVRPESGSSGVAKPKSRYLRRALYGVAAAASVGVAARVLPVWPQRTLSPAHLDSRPLRIADFVGLIGPVRSGHLDVQQ